jgi:hypothetical protein
VLLLGDGVFERLEDHDRAAVLRREPLERTTRGDTTRDSHHSCCCFAVKEKNRTTSSHETHTCAARKEKRSILLHPPQTPTCRGAPTRAPRTPR